MPDEIKEIRRELQDTMSFLGAISVGLEEFMGKPANGMSFLAGKKLGKQCSQNAPHTDDILESIEITKAILKDNGFLWQLEHWQDSGTDEAVTSVNGTQTVKLVFRDCMIRQTLFRHGHHQQGSLCYMMYGFFSGVTESILGRKSELKILHTGPNACLKELTLKGGK